MAGGGKTTNRRSNGASRVLGAGAKTKKPAIAEHYLFDAERCAGCTSTYPLHESKNGKFMGCAKGYECTAVQVAAVQLSWSDRREFASFGRGASA
jgi:ssDNA-binding Zn-finger/Zn-ribbon topoisomerase 1